MAGMTSEAGDPRVVTLLAGAPLIEALSDFDAGFLVGILVGEGTSAEMPGSPRSRCACTPITRRSLPG